MAFPYSSGDVLTAADLNASSGLVLVKTETIGTSVSSVTVTNAFSSTFENYRILVRVETASADAAIAMTLGSSTAGYYYGAVLTNWSSGFGNTYLSNGANWRVGATDTVGGRTVIDLMSPNLTTRTSVSFSGSYFDSSGYQEVGGGYHNNTSAYTGFTLSTGAATMTGGTIRVYGYNDGA